jgi:hypothetical protein
MLSQEQPHRYAPPHESEDSDVEQEVSPTIQRRLERFEKVYRASGKKEMEGKVLWMPDLDFQDEEGNPERVAQIDQGDGTTIVDNSHHEGTDPIVVETDRGVVVRADQESATGNLMMCTCALIVGPTKKVMVHFTPGTRRMAFLNQEAGNYAEGAGQRLVEAMEEANMDPSECKAIIIGNLGDGEPGEKQYYGTRQESWDAMKQQLEEAGVPSVKTVETPMNRTAVYHSPERPDHVAIIGYDAHYDENAALKTAPQTDLNEVRGFWLTMDGDDNFEHARPKTREQRRAEMPPPPPTTGGFWDNFSTADL